MSLGIKVAGGDGFLALRIQQEKLNERIRANISSMSREYRAEVVRALTAPKGGRRYGGKKTAIYSRQRVTVTLFGGQTATLRKNVRSKISAVAYTASRPGEPPASRTGTLVRAVRTKVPSRGKGWSTYIFAYRGTAFYRHFLEFGAKRPSRGRGGYRAPRPIWSPFQRRIEAELSTRVLGAVDAFVQGR